MSARLGADALIRGKPVFVGLGSQQKVYLRFCMLQLISGDRVYYVIATSAMR